jgi:hypothetical protein
MAVEASAVPSFDGGYDHSLTFTNGCDVRMYVTVRYSGEPGPAAGADWVAAGDTVTIPLSASQPNQGFSAYYSVKYRVTRDRSLARSTGEVRSTVEARSTGEARTTREAPSTGEARSTREAPSTRDARSTREAPSTREASTGTTRPTAPGAQAAARPPVSSAPAAGSLSLVELCDRATRKIFRLHGLSEKDPKLTARIANCPSRVNMAPQQRRAELECVLGASTREGVRACFGAQ